MRWPGSSPSRSTYIGLSRSRGMAPAAVRRPPAHAPAPWWAAVAGLALGLALALVVFAPARWLGQALSAATGSQIQLLSARGTVWQGSARLQLSGGAQSRDATALPAWVHWTLSPHWQGLGLSVSADCCTTTALQAQLRPGWGRAALQVQDGSSQWPAAVLAGLGTPWNTVLLEGQLALVTQGLSVEWVAGRMQLRGRAQLDALELGSRLSTLKPLGSYRVVISSPGTADENAAPAQLNLDTLSGDLRLSGSGQWVGGRLRFDGQASAAPEREAALANLLNILGRRQGASSVITIG